MELISQAAEAKIYKQESPEGAFVIKDRISKGYRHPELDKKIIKQRTKREAKLLEKANKLINSPASELIEQNKIKMPFIEGKKLSENLENLDWKNLCIEIGNKIALLHDNDIIHGDLTTSNMILADSSNNEKLSQLKKLKADKESSNLNNKNKREAEFVQASSKNRAEGEANFKEVDSKEPLGVLHFIDFGLGFISKRIEDKAVDLHLIKQALEAKHFSIHKEAEKIILDNYNSKDKSKVLEQLKKVELRGRYRH